MNIEKIVLLTGFEPFGIYVRNSSYDSIRDLDGAFFGKFKIVVKELPVRFMVAGKQLQEHIKQYKPQIVICFGMGTQYIQFETIALNINYSAREDNDGIKIEEEQKIKNDGPLAYRTTISYERIYEALKQQKIPIVQSFHAGTYLCNNIFYHLMYYAERYDIKLAGFFHLPPTPECFKEIYPVEQPAGVPFPTTRCVERPAIELQTLKTAVKIIVEECINSYKE